MLRSANSVENGDNKVRLGSYDGVLYTEQNGTTFMTVTVSPI